MEEIVVGISLQTGSLQDQTFIFLVKLMGYRNQLRMNHWQTKSYAEHKATDGLMEELTEYIDSIGEAALGAFGRPKINTMSTNISDIAICSSEYIVKSICTDVVNMLELYKDAEQEGIFALLGELDAIVRKFTFLLTLD
jgi:DNA-binding ferritin-like protein